MNVLNPRRWPSWWPIPAAVGLVLLLGMRHSRKAPNPSVPAWLSLPYPATTTQAELPPGWQLHAPGVGGTGIWPAGRFFRPTLSSAVPFPVTWTQSDDLTSVVEGLNGA